MIGKESSSFVMFSRLRAAVSGRPMALFLIALVALQTATAFGPSNTLSFRTTSQPRLSSSRLSALPFVDVDILRVMTEQASGVTSTSEGVPAVAPRAAETAATIGITALSAVGAGVALTVIVLAIIAWNIVDFSEKLAISFTEKFQRDYPKRFEEFKELALTELREEVAAAFGQEFYDDRIKAFDAKGFVFRTIIGEEKEEISQGLLRECFSEYFAGLDPESEFAYTIVDKMVKSFKEERNKKENRHSEN
eukprot:scaffold34637_cov187-Amphora_coffeaeformis.AAC.9